MSLCDGVCISDVYTDQDMEDSCSEKETIIRLRDVGTDNIATDKNRNGDVNTGRQKMKTFVKHLTMASTVPPLTTHVLNTATGKPASNVPMFLSRQNSSGGFDELERGTTNNDGRGGFLKGGNWQPGIYRLHFNTDAYFKQENTTGFYPYVEVVFRIVDPSQHYHVPLLLSPYGYSTYRGS